MEEKQGLPILPFAAPAVWEAWLDANHATAKGVWVKVAKKATGIPSVTHQELLDGALCYGWIDGQRNSFDDRWFLQKFTPRRPKSSWSQVNVEKVARLSAEHQMRPAGLAEVEAAKADGRWDRAYPPQTLMTTPDDLRDALAANPIALAAFDALTKQYRFIILAGIYQAKSPELRARRIARCVEKLTSAASDTAD